MQFLLISLFYFIGELMAAGIPLPVPAAVWGLVLLFTALCTGAVKLSQVEDAADYLLEIMSIMFVPPAIGIVNMFDILADSWWKIVIIAAVTTLTTIIITGHAAQGLLRPRGWVQRRNEKEEEEASSV